jgi:signal transduction histidine kinase/ligand-binding sensor domain-containing protein/DNA-binding response OmpR family regulator
LRAKPDDILIMNMRQRILLLVLICSLFSGMAFAHSPDSLHFARYSIEHGLPDSTINGIAQDREGFLWVATPVGLVRYDGRRFFQMRASHGLNTANAAAYGVAVGAQGAIWAVFEDGIYRLDRDSQVFSKFYDFQRTTISTVQVKQLDRTRIAVFFDNQFIVIDTSRSTSEQNSFSAPWAIADLALFNDSIYAVAHNKLFTGKLNSDAVDFTLFTHSALPDHHITAIDAGQKRLYISTKRQGLWQFDSDNQQVRRYLNDQHVIGAFRDRQQRLWVQTYAQGIWMFTQNSQKFSYFQLSDPHSIASNNITSIFESANGDIWIGTQKGGLNHHRMSTEHIYHLKHDTAKSSPISGNDVTAIAVDKYNRGWLAANADGISIHNPDSRVTQVIHSHLAGGNVTDIFIDEEFAWVLGDFGMTKISIDTLAVEQTYNPDTTEIPFANLVKWVNLDESSGFLLHRNAGVTLFNKVNNTFVHYDHTNTALPTQHFDYGVNYNGFVWLVSNVGIHAYNPKTENFDNFAFGPDIPITQINHMTIHNDEFVLSTNRGLYFFDPLYKQFHNRGVPDEVAESNLQATIVYIPAMQYPDDWTPHPMHTHSDETTEDVYFSTSKNGLLRYQLGRKEVAWFVEDDGLQGNEFNPGVAYHNDKGRFVFAGINGITVLEPSLYSKASPNIVLAEVAIFFRDGKQQHFIRTPDWNTLDHAKISNIQYFLGDTNFTTHRNTVIRVNDNQAIYKTDDFVYSQTPLAGANRLSFIYDKQSAKPPVAIDIAFKQPNEWFRNYIFLAVLALLSVFIVISVYQWRLALAKKHNQLLLLRLEQRKQQFQAHQAEIEARCQLAEKNLTEKNQLFENIATELKIPLSLIIEPLQRLAPVLPAGLEQPQLTSITRNAHKLRLMVNKVFELSQADYVAHHNDIQDSCDLAHVITQNIHNIQQTAEHRDIHINFIPIEPFKIALSLEDANSILANLCLNAVYYNRINGSITVSVESTKDLIYLKVSNTGKGMSEAECQQALTRFYRTESASQQYPDGVGLGLNIVQNIVTKNKGELFIASQPEVNTTVTVVLPNLLEQSLIPQRKNNDELPRALCIDDNQEILSYLDIALNQSFALTLLNSPVDALEISRDILPDIIISDIMMPHIDGIMLMSQIKEDPLLSHIPIILISARTSQNDILEGLRNDAADYICKPFDNEELRLKALNLINIQKKSRQQVVERVKNVNSEQQNTPELSKFMSALVAACEAQYHNPDFSIKELGVALDIGSRQLQRKVKAETDQSPSEFLRNYRVKKGAELLLEGNTATSASYAVGFMTPSYFITCFKKLYGQTPKQFTLQHQPEQTVDDGASASK